MTLYNKFMSVANLELAWKRVRYFDRPNSRDMPGLKAFASNYRGRLSAINQLLAYDRYQSAYPEIKYLPKSSGGERPIAVLTTKDRVVYQAVVNIIAENARYRLGKIENKYSFANVLREGNTPRMYYDWHNQYKHYCSRIRNLYNHGSKWIAETDIESFYGSIDHGILFEKLSRYNLLDKKLLAFLEEHLPVWASREPGMDAYVGLPQASISSDLLANIFLLDIDVKISGQNRFSYLRYSDDIKIIADSKEKVSSGLNQVQRLLGNDHLGLQYRKTLITQVGDIDKYLDKMSGTLSYLDYRMEAAGDEKLIWAYMQDGDDDNDRNSVIDVNDSKMCDRDDSLYGSDRTNVRINLADSITEKEKEENQEQLYDILSNAIDEIESGSETKFTERHLRYSLYRLEPIEEVANRILKYIELRPALCNAIFAYLNKSEMNDQLYKTLTEIVVKNTALAYIITEAISLLHSRGYTLLANHGLFEKWLLEYEEDWSILESLIRLIGNEQKQLVFLRRILLTAPDGLVRRSALIQTLQIVDDFYIAVNIINSAIYDQSPYVIDVLLYQMYYEYGLTLEDLDIDYERLSDYFFFCAVSFEEMLPAANNRYIEDIMEKKYRINSSVSGVFRNLLADNYDRAAGFLHQADGSYLVNYNRYVLEIDLFNKELLNALIAYLNISRRKRDLFAVPHGELIKILRAKIPVLQKFFKAVDYCHELTGNIDPGYDISFGAVFHDTYISWQERDIMKNLLAEGYSELVSFLSERENEDVVNF